MNVADDMECREPKNQVSKTTKIVEIKKVEIETKRKLHAGSCERFPRAIDSVLLNLQLGIYTETKSLKKELGLITGRSIDKGQ